MSPFFSIWVSPFSCRLAAYSATPTHQSVDIGALAWRFGPEPVRLARSLLRGFLSRDPHVLCERVANLHIVRTVEGASQPETLDLDERPRGGRLERIADLGCRGHRVAVDVGDVVTLDEALASNGRTWGGGQYEDPVRYVLPN
jgi:hypothetical protein